MIQIPKKIAFLIFISVTVLLAFSFNSVDWNVLEATGGFHNKFKELRETLIFLILAIFYLKYYVDILKKDKKTG